MVPDHLLEETIHESHPRLIVAIDFGTTYSAVSYASIVQGQDNGYLPLKNIRSIGSYPDDWNFDAGDRMKYEVPTEVIYPLTNRHFRKQEDLNLDEENEDD